MPKIQYTLTINQLAISEGGFEIDIVDAAIIDFVRHFIASEEMDIRDFGGERYYRLHSSHVSAQLPILGLKPEPITRRISALVDKGYFKRIVQDGNTPWIRPTDKAKSIYGGPSFQTGGSVPKDGGGPSQKTDNNCTSNNYTSNKNTETHGTIVPAAQAPEEYGNRDINELLEAMKAVCKSLGWAYDKTADRMFARHILTAKDFREFAESQNCTARDYALGIMKASAKLDFWYGKACGPKSVYQNHAKIYNAHQESKRAAAPTGGIDQAKERNARINRHEEEAERARQEAIAEGDRIMAYLDGLPEERKARITGEVDAFIAQMNIGTEGLLASRAHRIARRARLVKTLRAEWEQAGKP